jgi:alginate O-acetyltransferase complex protein AlgI
MLFNSTIFLFLFLPAVTGSTFLLFKRGYSLVYIFWGLTISSFVFYSYWNPSYILLLILSIVVNYLFGIQLGANRKKSILFIAILFNLGILGYFKYSKFVFSIFFNSTDSFNFPVFPLAISFFTFQQIAFLVDTYQKKTEEKSFVQYCLFVSFFPQLVAGPIVKHQYVKNQFRTIHVNRDNVVQGMVLFLIGLSKKLLIADRLSHFTYYYFSSGVHYDFVNSWLAALCFAFEIYFDFSAYSDMAIGIAKIFNIKFPDNFESPYQSTSISEFWRRWHMTLSFFFRDYLYIPLGGSRHGSFRLVISLFITMFLCGLWHGANWTFILWGIIHGAFLAINRLWHKIIANFHFRIPQRLSFVLSWAITFLSVVIAFVVFRTKDIKTAISIWSGMFGFNGVFIPIPHMYSKYFSFLDFLGIHVQTENINLDMLQNMGLSIILILMCIVLIWLPSAKGLSRKLTLEPSSRSYIFLSLLTSLCLLFINENRAFIYFEF